jgi:hypothetical protein
VRVGSYSDVFFGLFMHVMLAVAVFNILRFGVGLGGVESLVVALLAWIALDCYGVVMLLRTHMWGGRKL